MAQLENYDPGLIVLTLGGAILSGFADGTFITVERNEDSFEAVTGSDGFTTRVRKRNKSGTVTITLQAESPSNSILYAKVIQDELTGDGVSPLAIQNLGNGLKISAADAWVRKPASAEFSNTATTREWVIECASLMIEQ